MCEPAGVSHSLTAAFFAAAVLTAAADPQPSSDSTCGSSSNTYCPSTDLPCCSASYFAHLCTSFGQCGCVPSVSGSCAATISNQPAYNLPLASVPSPAPAPAPEPVLAPASTPSDTPLQASASAPKSGAELLPILQDSSLASPPPAAETPPPPPPPVVSASGGLQVHIYYMQHAYMSLVSPPPAVETSPPLPPPPAVLPASGGLQVHI